MYRRHEMHELLSEEIIRGKLRLRESQGAAGEGASAGSESLSHSWDDVSEGGPPRTGLTSISSCLSKVEVSSEELLTSRFVISITSYHEFSIEGPYITEENIP